MFSINNGKPVSPKALTVFMLLTSAFMFGCDGSNSGDSQDKMVFRVMISLKAMPLLILARYNVLTHQQAMKVVVQATVMMPISVVTNPVIRSVTMG